MNIPILYEDNHLLAVEKPANMLVQGDQSGDQDLLTVLKEDIKIRYEKPGNVFLGLVHRLDRPVAGVMVFAKTSKAASRLSDAIRRRDFHKKYLAVVHGKPKQNQAMLEHYLVKHHRENKVQVVPEGRKGAKKALLEYEVIGHAEPYSLLAIQLHTGRPHQIRVQLAAIGTPIFGDQKYGRHVNVPGQQIALWSHELEFKHPTKDERVAVTSLPPYEYPWQLWPEYCKLDHETESSRQ